MPTPDEPQAAILTDAQCDEAIRSVGLWQWAWALPQNLTLLRGLCRAAIAAQASAVGGEQAAHVTDEMVAAYLTANDAYWKGVDELAPKLGTWRAGTPKEATRISLQAALRASAKPSPSQSGPKCNDGTTLCPHPKRTDKENLTDGNGPSCAAGLRADAGADLVD